MASAMNLKCRAGEEILIEMNALAMDIILKVV
jgi:hypothetical protein